MPSRGRTRRRIRRIEAYGFPRPLVDKLVERSDEVTRMRAEAGIEELRAWFIARCEGRETPPSPTGGAEAAWREFILMTKKYREFCDKAFGGYLHYPPEDAR